MYVYHLYIYHLETINPYKIIVTCKARNYSPTDREILMYMIYHLSFNDICLSISI